MRSGGAKRQQGDAIAQDYEPLAKAAGLPSAGLTVRPRGDALVQLAIDEHATRLHQELAEAAAPVVVALREEARRVLLAIRSRGLQRRRRDGSPTWPETSTSTTTTVWTASRPPSFALSGGATGWSTPTTTRRSRPQPHRIWPAPFDLDTACWHVALAFAAVYGLQPDGPVLGT